MYRYIVHDSLRSLRYALCATLFGSTEPVYNTRWSTFAPVCSMRNAVRGRLESVSYGRSRQLYQLYAIRYDSLRFDLVPILRFDSGFDAIWSIVGSRFYSVRFNSSRTFGSTWSIFDSCQFDSVRFDLVLLISISLSIFFFRFYQYLALASIL